MRTSLPLLVASLLVFLVAAGLTLLSLELDSEPVALVAIAGMAVSVALFLLAFILPRRKVDWERIEVEQKLWESGPLGRKWLRTRQRLYRRFRM